MIQYAVQSLGGGMAGLQAGRFASNLKEATMLPANRARVRISPLDLPQEELARFRKKFNSKLKSNGDCSEFTGAKRTGYGRIYVRGERLQAHRVAWALAGRELPAWPLQLDHLCRNRACVKVDHLRIATPRENTLSGVGCTAVNAAKSACPSGHAYGSTSKRARGEQRRCRFCEASSARRRYATNATKISERGRIYREANAEKERERHQTYRANHREREREAHRAYYLANRERILGKCKARRRRPA